MKEFERERTVRGESGYPEDPLYLTLLSNRDSFRGYKRPRIDTCSSGLAVKRVSRDVSMGFLDESVFATPTDDNIFRPDGNLTENPLPYSNKSGMRSIRDFIADKTSKYDKNHDALTDDEIVESSTGESSQEEITENNPKPIKSKFVVPFIKECSSPLVEAPVEEKQQISKSYDTFLQSLVAPNITVESFTREEITHPLLQTNDSINSLMMPIIKWKENYFAMDTSKEQLAENCYRSDRVEDNESTLNTNAGSYGEECVEQSIVRSYVNKAEKTVNDHLEADTNESGIFSEMQSVSRDDSNTELTSSNSEQICKEFSGEVYDVKLEEQDCSSEANRIVIVEENCLQVDQGLDKVETRVSTPEHIDTATMKINTDELVEREISNEMSPTDSVPKNEGILPQSSDSPKEVPIPEFTLQHCNKNNDNTSQEYTHEVDDSQAEIKYISNMVNSCIENVKLMLERENKIPEVEEVSVLRDTSIQCPQVVTLQEKSSNTELLETECKQCQTRFEIVQKECQTDNIEDTYVIQEDKSNQTEILQIQFPITSNNEQVINEYDNFILYQQQVIRALQEVELRLLTIETTKKADH